MTENAWTWMEPEVDMIKNIRNEIRDVVPSEWIEETKPHISILPGFEAPEKEMEHLLNACKNVNDELIGKTIEITGFHCHNSLDSNEPTFVIGLDVNMKLKPIRNKQKILVNQSGGDLLYDPVNAHITLFKEGDGNDENGGLNDEQIKSVQRRLNKVKDDAHFETTVLSAPAMRF